MKQKLKDLLKKKPARATIAEMMIDPAFTVLTDEQKAGKKAGATDDAFNRNSLENANFGLLKNNGFSPTNNNLGRGSNNSLSSATTGREFEIVDGIPISYRGSDVIITGTRIKKPNLPQSPTHPNFPTHPNIPYWPSNTLPPHIPTQDYSNGTYHLINRETVFKPFVSIPIDDKTRAFWAEQDALCKRQEVNRIASVFASSMGSEEAIRYVEAIMKYSPKYFYNDKPKVAPYHPGTDVSTPVTKEMLDKWTKKHSATTTPNDKTHVGDEWQYKNGETSTQLPEVVVKTEPIAKQTDTKIIAVVTKPSLVPSSTSRGIPTTETGPIQSTLIVNRSRPDTDAYITLSEANDWYRNGGGKPLFVDLGKINLQGISASDFKNKVGSEKYFNLLFGNSHSINDGLVYGTIKLTYLGNNKVSASHDIYDFDAKKWESGTFIRNAETMLGKLNAGDGKGYRINFQGEGVLNEPFDMNKEK